MSLRKETHNEIKFMRIPHKAFKLLLTIDFMWWSLKKYNFT